jgi:serine/threonine protein kinase
VFGSIGDLELQLEMTKLRQLGGGSFSTVFQVELTSHDVAVMCKVRKAGMLPPDNRAALKIQKTERPEAAFDELVYESRVLRELEGVHGVPKVFWQGVFEGDVASVHSLHGTSLLDTLKTHCKATGCRFSLGRLVDIAHPLLDIIEATHSFAIVHRDLKPANVLLNGDAVCLIDWGLSKKIIYPGGEHIRNEQSRPFIGSTYFASLNKHDGMSSSRRDDIESLVYMLLFLHRVLPWEGMDDEPDRAARLKRSISSSQLEPFGDMLAYARGLRFEQEADFRRLHDMLTVIRSKNASASGSGFATLPSDKTEDSEECLHSSKRQRT